MIIKSLQFTRGDFVFLYWFVWPCLMWWHQQYGYNWSNSPIPECTCSISHNAPFRTEMCTFLFWMEHCMIWNKCILGFVHFDSEWSIVGYGTSEFWDLYISVLNGALWDIEQVHSGMCETGQYLTTMKHNKVQTLFIKPGMHCNSNKVWI